MLQAVVKVVVGAALCYGVFELPWRLLWRLEVIVDRHALASPLTGPVLPTERVSHLVADSHASVADDLSNFLMYSLMGLAVFAYVTADDGWVEPFSSYLLAGVAVLCAITVGKAHTYARLMWARARILAKLERERQVYDPAGTFPQLIVVHRDRSDAITLFDRLSVEAYRRGMAVRQYGTLVWPCYQQRVTPTTGNVWVLPEPNPAIVRTASAIVWLDIDEPSAATDAEIAEARRADKSILRIVGTDDGRYRLMADAFEGTAAFDEVAGAAIDWAVSNSVSS
ncbi:MAG: hypothetical protein ACRD2I_26380 [Vicinamibacterales bacterium]